MALVSIITPVYNTEKYLEQCIMSILNQTFEDIELILINDGSTDRSVEIMEKYRSLDSRVKVINQDNSGVAIARNTGIHTANGKYIMWVDSDDWIEPNMVEALVKETIDRKMPIMVAKSAEYAFRCRMLEGNDLIMEFIDGMLPSAMWTTIFSKADYEDVHFRNYLIGEDSMMLLDLFYKVKKVGFVYNENYHYRINSNSITNNPSIEKVYSWLEEVEKQREIVIERYPLVKSKMNFKAMIFALDIIKNYQASRVEEKAKGLLKQSVKDIRIFDLSNRQKKRFVVQIIKNWRIIFC